MQTVYEENILMSIIFRCLQGSTVNFNVMGPLYDAIDRTFDGHKCLGIALMIGIIYQ